MKRLIISCDGTWNTPDQEEGGRKCPTNVVKFHNSVLPVDSAGVKQETYYHPGVGTEGGALSRIAGGAYGKGLSRNIKSAYKWLACHYETGDEIYLLGFSRGAYTARSLAGFIGRCGLPVTSGQTEARIWERVETAYLNGYRERDPKWRKPSWQWNDAPVSIKFLGVWDTVGALGIPDDLAILNLIDDPGKWSFHDTELGKHVNRARHAVAIDELRASFTPTLWTDGNGVPLADSGDGRVKQFWFAGVHSDVGGGYEHCGLSDLSLKWMIDEAAAAGLAFDPALTSQLSPDFRGPIHNSLKGPFKALKTRPRAIPSFTNAVGFHDSSLQRHKAPPITDAPYHRTVNLPNVGDTTTIPIYSRALWNSTGIWLEPGAAYKFTAKGEWKDSSIVCGPAGTADGKFQLGETAHLIGSFIGKLEGGFSWISGNKDADFWMTRRREDMPWFSLVGVIANDGDHGAKPAADGTPDQHEYFLIGKGPVKRKIDSPGYLHAFANDAWSFYQNNNGSVMLTVERVG